MRIEQGFNPNCSEAVFRFYTEDPKVAHRILQAFADEVAETNEHSAEIVPEFQDMEKIKQLLVDAELDIADYTKVSDKQPAPLITVKKEK